MTRWISLPKVGSQTSQRSRAKTIHFPPHNNGQWAKKVKGKLYYFGCWDNPDAALREWTRYTFETIAGESRDQAAVDRVMGHTDNSMSVNYRHRISDERLQHVNDFVREWLWLPDGFQFRNLQWPAVGCWLVFCSQLPAGYPEPNPYMAF
jgi:hypothetical protein